MDTWKLKDLRDGKVYLYIVELEGNVLTRSYGWEGGKLRKSTRSYDQPNLARADADKIVDKQIKEGYELVESPEEPETADINTEPDAPDMDTPAVDPGDLFPIERLMRVRSAKFKHPVLICSLPDGYQFKVFPDQEYTQDVIGQQAKLDYQKVDTFGVPIDPVFVKVTNV